MLIFDNILFATLIPQLLMFMGVITCFTESYISSCLDKNSKKNASSITIEYSDNKYDEYSSAISFEEFYSDFEFLQRQASDNSFFKLEERIIYPVFNQTFH